MKRPTYLWLLPIGLFITVAARLPTADGKPERSGTKAPVVRQDTFDQEAALAKLRKEIEGREDQPSEMVFSNIGTLLGVPAGRLLRIMEMGYSNSLGVNCTHCHDPADWASDEKPAKQISRDMAEMVVNINKGLLLKIENLDSKNPRVNCTTCHRGEVKPALRMKE